jgi:hypothetical protein
VGTPETNGNVKKRMYQDVDKRVRWKGRGEGRAEPHDAKKVGGGVRRPRPRSSQAGRGKRPR